MSTQPNLHIDLGNLELSEMPWRMIGEYRLREMLLFLFAAIVGGATILYYHLQPKRRVHQTATRACC